jgi:hypothetical protein
MTTYEVLIFAFCGGLAVNVLRLCELQTIPRAERPATFSDPLYVLQFVFLPLAGAGLAYMYQRSGTNLNAILAVNIGASTPLILKSLASAAPSISKGRVN